MLDLCKVLTLWLIAVFAGVVSTPGIAIDGQVVQSNGLPRPATLPDG
ncbi:MAG TPA: hypothetical protein PLY97_07910 [Acidocella sp.]|nr:hypothetical protein [Acidocella sp.]